MSKATPEITTTIRDLGRKVRRSPSTIHGYIEHPGWRWGRGPWSETQIREIEAWAAETFIVSKGDPAVTAARVELMRETLALLNLQNEIAAGEWCNVSKVQELVVRAALDAKRPLMDLCWNTAAFPRGASVSETEIREALERYVQVIENDYRAAQATVAEASTAEADPVQLRRDRRSRRVEGAGNSRPRAAGAPRPAASREGAREKVRGARMG
jgi:hypothetical protein